MRILTLIPVLLVLFIASCDTLSGDFNENLPPKTFLAVEEINLPDGDRLSSQVRIRWWGNDPDGYVAGYEYCIGAIASCGWNDVGTTTDSTFVLPIPEGEPDADVRFSVRAYDNLGLRDPEPATVVFPIKNTPPTIEFNIIETPPDTTYHFFSFGWRADDLDGFDNLNYIEVAINDTSSWVRLPIDIDFVSVRINNPEMDVTDGQIFVGRALNTSNLLLPNIRMNDDNMLYIKAVDNSLAQSRVDTTSWYIKRQTSRLLVLLDDDRNPLIIDPIIENLFAIIGDIGFTSYDILDISDGVPPSGQKVPLSRAFPQVVEPTLQQALAEWDYIIWYTNNFDRNITYAIEATSVFLQNGGSVFVNSPTKNTSPDDPAVQFLPMTDIQRTVAGVSSYRLPGGPTLSTPVQNAPFNTLDVRTLLVNVFPYQVSPDIRVLLEGAYTNQSGGEVSGISRVIASVNDERNIGYLGINFDNLRGFRFRTQEGQAGHDEEVAGRENITNFLRYVLIDELGFQP